MRTPELTLRHSCGFAELCLGDNTAIKYQSSNTRFPNLSPLTFYDAMLTSGTFNCQTVFALFWYMTWRVVA
jgi:hypothetical protein